MPDPARGEVLTPIAQMRAQQAQCAAVLASGRLTPSDEFGAKLGLQDAIKEEVLLLLASKE